MQTFRSKISAFIFGWLQKLGLKPPAKVHDRYIAKMIGLGEMVGSIIHEVANPMFSLLSSVDQLRAMNKQAVLPKEEFLRSVLTLETNLQRINNIFSSLKNYCRDDDDQPYSEINVKEIFLDAIDLSQEQLQKQNIRFLFSIEDENATIECHPTQIQQCILNLLNNAIHAVSLLDVKWISVVVLTEGKMLKISITDSGSGIPKDIQHKIMAPFFTTKRKGEGIGLGLSLSKRVVDAHQGSLTIDTKSHNTCFQITLPRRQFASNKSKHAA